MKSKIFPNLPELNLVPTTKKNILFDTIFSSANPLRIIALAPIFGILICSLDIPSQATLGIFGWIGLVIAISVGFNAIVERNVRIPGKTIAWLLYISTTSLGTISLEFAGILAHTATFLISDPSTAALWDHVSIALLIGGFGLSAFQSYIKRFNRAILDERVKIIFIVSVIPALIYLEILAWIHIAPMILANLR